jgi:hypothetical protein
VSGECCTFLHSLHVACFLLLLNSVSKDLESCVVATRNVSGFSKKFCFFNNLNLLLLFPK